MTDAKKVLTPKCKEQIWTRADIDKLAYDFWAIHPQELDAWYKGDMPTGFKGGVRAWYFASKIRAALTAATERAEKAEQECAQIGSDAEAQSYLDADGVPVEKARLRSEWVGQRDRITALEAERDALKADRETIIRGAMLLEQKLKTELSDAVAKVAKYEMEAFKEMQHQAEAAR